jgi:hypothetical protein
MAEVALDLPKVSFIVKRRFFFEIFPTPPYFLDLFIIVAMVSSAKRDIFGFISDACFNAKANFKQADNCLNFLI